jgi:hypothetical protein
VFFWRCSGVDHGVSSDDSVLLAFDQSAGYDIGADPRAVRAADIDGDGDVDFVVLVLGRDSSKVSFFVNNGDRDFESGQELVAPALANDAEFADFDNDGDVDLVVAAEPSALLLNDSRGHYSQISLGKSAWNVAPGYLDADGDQDIALGGRSLAPSLTVLLNTGNGDFIAGFEQRDLRSPTDVALADLNGDGHTDIATCNALGANLLVFLISHMDENSANWSPRALPAGVFPYAISAADIDGDSDQDLIVGNLDSDNIAVYENLSPDDEIGFPQYFPAGGYPRVLVCADVTRDGFPEVVTCDGNDVLILINDGKGSFDSTVRESLTGEIRAVAVADLDGDGYLDIIAADTSGKLTLLYGRP